MIGNVYWFSYEKGKSVPLQVRSCTEGSRKLRFPDFVTTAQDGGSECGNEPSGSVKCGEFLD